MTKNENLPFQYEEKEVITALFEEVVAALKDSDATAEKEMIRDFLRSVSERIMFVTLGSMGVGKTSMLNEIFERGEEDCEREIQRLDFIFYHGFRIRDCPK